MDILLSLVRSADGNEDKAISPLNVFSGKATVSQWWENRKQNDFGFKPFVDTFDQSSKDYSAAQAALFGPSHAETYLPHSSGRKRANQPCCPLH